MLKIQGKSVLKGVHFLRNCGAALMGNVTRSFGFNNGVDNVNKSPLRICKAKLGQCYLD